MDCRDFRNNHVGFVDDTLCAAQMEAMRRHRDGCADCARRDTAIRRGLLLVRNLPCIEPSPDFMARLHGRLHSLERVEHSVQGWSAISVASFLTMAAGIALVALLGYEMSTRALARERAPLRLAPVVASEPDLPPTSPVATPAFAASAPTGMGLWPAVLMAGEAQLHMASLQLQDSR